MNRREASLLYMGFASLLSFRFVLLVHKRRTHLEQLQVLHQDNAIVSLNVLLAASFYVGSSGILDTISALVCSVLLLDTIHFLNKVFICLSLSLCNPWKRARAASSSPFLTSLSASQTSNRDASSTWKTNHPISFVRVPASMLHFELHKLGHDFNMLVFRLTRHSPLD